MGRSFVITINIITIIFVSPGEPLGVILVAPGRPSVGTHSCKYDLREGNIP
jgi:hypothetical protein